MDKLKRPNGVAVIGCQCANPVWPLLVVRRIAINGSRWLPWWNLTSLIEYYPGTVRGKCPLCRKQFHAEIYCNDLSFFRRARHLIGTEEITKEDIIEEEGMPNLGKAMCFGYAPQAEGSREYYPVLKILTLNASIVPLSCRKESFRPHRVSVMSRSGYKVLYVDSEVKVDFVLNVQSLLKQSDSNVNVLPDWQSDGTNEQFEQWVREIGRIYINICCPHMNFPLETS